MPYKTEHGSHYHLRDGCCGATIPCGTEGLTPCSICVTQGHGGAPSAETGGSSGHGGAEPYRGGDAYGSATPSALLRDRLESFMEMTDQPEEAETLRALFSVDGQPLAKDDLDEILLTAAVIFDAVSNGEPSEMPEPPDNDVVARVLSERIIWADGLGGIGASGACPYPSWLMPSGGPETDAGPASPHRSPEKRNPDRWRECHVKGGVMSCPDHCEAAKRGILEEITKASSEEATDNADLIEDLTQAQEAIEEARRLGIRRHALLSGHNAHGSDERSRLDEIREIDSELQRLDKVIQKRHGARQNHGFVWESAWASVFGGSVRKASGYTDKDDAFLRLPGGAEVACSMKSRKGGGEVDFADMRRIINSTDPVVLFLQTRNGEGAWDVHAVLYPEGLSALCGTADASSLERSMDEFMSREIEVAGSRKALHSHAFDERHKRMLGEYIKEFAKSTKGKGCVLNPRIKRDHKNQYRMQCAVSNADLEDMIAKGIQIGDAMTMDDFMAMGGDEARRQSFLSSIEQKMPSGSVEETAGTKA